MRCKDPHACFTLTFMATERGEDGLTHRMRRFVDEFMVDLSATRAAIRAGYSAHSAGQAGVNLLADPRVAAALEEAVRQRSTRTKVTADEVLLELAKLARSNMQDYMGSTDEGEPYLDFRKLTREQTAALQEVTVEEYVEGRGENARDVKRVKFRLYDKRAALVDIGRHLGMFTERREVRFPDGVPVTQLTKEEFKELAGGVVAEV